MGEERELRERWGALLVSAADARGAALERWFAEAWVDAGAIAGFPTARYLVDGSSSGDTPFPRAQGGRAHLEEILSRFAEGSGRRIWVLDREGRVAASSAGAGQPPASAREAARAAAAGSRRELRFEPPPGEPAASFAAAIEAGSRDRGGALVLTEGLTSYVHPLLAPSQPFGSTELVLVRRRGAGMEYLSPLRASPGPGPSALSPAEWPRVGEGVDYRGKKSLFVLRPLSAPDLFLLAKVDRAEALGPADVAGAVLGALVLALGAAMTAVAALVVRRSDAAHARQLARSEARAALILDNISDAVLFAGEDFRIVGANRAAERLYGRSREEMQGTSAFDLRFPETRANGPARWAEIPPGGEIVFEAEHVHSSGSRLPVEATVKRVEIEGRPMYLGLVRDLRERKRVEESLGLAVEAARLGIYDWDLRTGELVWGGHHERMFGFAPGGFDRRYETFLERVHPEDRELVQERIEASRRARQEFQCEYRIRRPDGSVHWIFDRGRFEYSEAGEAVRMRGAIQETTTLHRAADDLRNLYRAIEQSPVSVVITDASGTIEYVNPCFCDVTGYSRPEALGQNPRLLKSGEQPSEFYAEMWATLLAGREWRGRLRNRRKDGSLFDEDAVISPVTDDAGRITHYIAVKQDVTELLRREDALRSSQAQLAQAQKMEALGRLAGGIAHDFNNLLGVILGYAELAQRKIAPEDPLHRKLGEIAKAAERGGALTRQLLAYSRKQVLTLTTLDLNALVAEAAKLLTRLLGEDVALVVQAGKGLWSVKADRGQLDQVLMNLAVNARDAMPEGGTLTLTTSNEEIGREDPRRRGLMPAGRYVRLAVTDTGVGMSREVLHNIFEPFFTTKEKGRGTGLGLAMVYGAVKQSDGFVWVESAPGQGTTFEVFLPAVAGAPSPEPPRPAVGEGGSGELILLLEDSDVLRAVVREVLTQARYEVLEAADGEAAVAIAVRERGRLALLLSDVVLPRRSGLEVAAEIQALQPGIRVLFTSGYTADAGSVQRVLDAGHAFLPKPATPEALLTKVREVLGSTRSPSP